MKPLIGQSMKGVLRHFIDLFENKILVFFDTETTGLDPYHGQLTEISAIIVKPEFIPSGDGYEVKLHKTAEFTKKCLLSERTLNLMVLEDVAIDIAKNPLNYINHKSNRLGTYLSLAKPHKDYVDGVVKQILSKGRKKFKTIEEILNLNMYGENVNYCVKEDDALEQFMDFITKNTFGNGTDEVILIAQNTAFDIKYTRVRSKLLKSSYHRFTEYCGILDTWPIFGYYLMPLVQYLSERVYHQWAKDFLDKYPLSGKFQNGLPTVSLGEIAPRMGISNENWHNSLGDTNMLIDTLEKAFCIMGEFPNAIPIRYQLLREQVRIYYAKKLWKKGEKFPIVAKSIAFKTAKNIEELLKPEKKKTIGFQKLDIVEREQIARPTITAGETIEVPDEVSDFEASLSQQMQDIAPKYSTRPSASGAGYVFEIIK